MQTESLPRKGTTVVELMVVVAIAAIAASLALPAILFARESARLTDCRNNLRQIGLALHNYHTALGTFPPSKIGAHMWSHDAEEPDDLEIEDNPDRVTEYASWTVMCLPFLEQRSLAARYNPALPWSHLANREVVSARLAVFECPSTPDIGRRDQTHVVGAARTDYGAVGEVEEGVYTDLFGVPCPGEFARRSVLAEHSANPASEVLDGLSNTIMVGECNGRPQTWVLGKPMSAAQFAAYDDDDVIEVNGRYLANGGIGWADPEAAFDVVGVMADGVETFGPRMINGTNAGQPYSFHPNGAMFLMGDGAVRFLHQDIDPWTFVSLATRAGREITDDF